MLVERIELVVRLIRSKGVGVYSFVTQVPTDIPDSVLAQLGNRGASTALPAPLRPRRKGGRKPPPRPCAPTRAQYRGRYYRTSSW